jgi:glycosyltransferase involved in cell wall biosynthesis
MNICYLANAASIHTQRWATHFSKRGHKVTVLSLTNANIPAVTVRWIGPDANARGPVAYLLCLPRLRRALRELKPDILHAHYAGGYGMAAALTGFHPLVTTAMGSDVLIVARDSRVSRQVIRHSLRQADLVTSCSRHMTTVIEDLGIKPERLLTLPYGVDAGVFHPGIRQQLASPASSPLIVSTRTLEPVYNVELLIEALPGVMKEFPRAKTLIIGDGRERAKLQARAQELGIARYVTFLGKKRPVEIADYLSAADVFVSTALSDGNNISLNEAMACGAFPIATDIPANREWINHGENGFLTGVHDPAALTAWLNRALAEKGLRDRAADSNWSIIQQRGLWSAAMETIETQYRNLTSNKGRPEPIRLATGV